MAIATMAIETMGAIERAGHSVRQCTGMIKARGYLLRRLSVTVQIGNAASELGSLGGRLGPSCIFTYHNNNNYYYYIHFFAIAFMQWICCLSCCNYYHSNSNYTDFLVLSVKPCRI